MRIIPLRLTLRFRERGTRRSMRRTQKKLDRVQARLQRVEREKQHLLHRWSLLDSSLQVQQSQQQERQLPMPPHLQTLDQYLLAKEQQKAQQQEALELFRTVVSVPETTPISFPSSMLRPQDS